MSEKLVVRNRNDPGFDSPDAEPRRDKLTTENHSLKAAWYDYLYIGYSIGIYIADVVTDMLVSVKYFHNGDYIWFSLTLLCVFGASLVMMVFSLKWFYDDTAEEVSKTKTVVLHAFQLGPLKRYWDCYKIGRHSRKEDADRKYYNIYLEQWRDLTMLRLFEVFIESAPQLVLQLYILAYNRRFDEDRDWLTALSACFSLLSLSSSIVSYSKALRDASEDKGKMTWWAFGCQIVWRLTMVASRIVTLVLFASVYKSWILLAIGIHWVAMTVWIRRQETTFCSDNRILRFMYPVVIGFVYVFCFFNVKDGFTRKRLVFFYVLMLVENCVLMFAWYPYRHEYGVVFVAAMVMVFGGYIVGAVALVLYYQCYHPSLPRQGICVRTSHEVPSIEGIVYRMLCCGTCCHVRSYEDEETSPPRGTPLYIDIEATRGSLRDDVVRGDQASSSSPPFEREVLLHKPSQLQKQYSLEKERNKKEKAERARQRHSLESGVENGGAKSVVVQGRYSMPAWDGTVSQQNSPPKDFEAIQLQNMEGRNDNELAYSADVHKSNETLLTNGTLPHPSSPSSNFEVNQLTNGEVRNENGILHSVDVHKPNIGIHKARITQMNNGCGPVVDNSNTAVDIDSNHNISPVLQNDRQEIGSRVVIGGTDGDEVHRGTDDSKETRTSCDDGVHCGTDDEKETRTLCDDGVHCGTDDERETTKTSGTSCDDGVHCGTDDEKETRKSCDDGVHCGTDDERETKTSGTSCDDGLHCGTDDENDTKSTKPTRNLTQSQRSENKRNNFDTISSKTHCDTELHSGNDHVDDECEVTGSHVHNTRDPGAPVTRLSKYSDSVNFHHRYSIVSDCISLSSSTSSENDDGGFLAETPNLDEKTFSFENPGSAVTNQTVDINSNIGEQLLEEDKSPSTNSECILNTAGSLPRSYVTKRKPKQRAINRRSKQSNRVSFPNFVATNLRRGRFSSLRRSHEDCTMEVGNTRRHTVDFSVLTSRKPQDETTRFSKTLGPKKFGSVRDELERLSLD